MEQQLLLKPNKIHEFTHSSFNDCNFADQISNRKHSLYSKVQHNAFDRWATSIISDGPIRFMFRGCEFFDCDFTKTKLTPRSFYFCYMRNCKLPFKLPDPHKVMKRTAKYIIKNNLKIKMGQFHTCDTAHCVAGWAYTIHPSLKKLQNEIGAPSLTGLLFGDYSELIYETNDEEAWEFLKIIAKS